MITGTDDKVAHGCYVSDEAIAKGVNSTELGQAVSTHIGGKAGGKGNIVQGMGDKPEGIEAAVESVIKAFQDKL